jgi:NAD-dependent deacetylase
MDVSLMKKIVVLTGSGISAESGLKTFRDSGGLWEEYNVMDVASIEGWYKNPELVLDFYNQRRKQLKSAEPNGAHIGLAELQKDFDVQIITQNIDDLHERAGSRKVLHLHGELNKARSSRDDNYIVDITGKDIHMGDLCPRGSQLRPFIVWFGEAVPAMEEAIKMTSTADIFVVIGSSLNVYPAAGLVDYVPHGAKIYLIDPKDVDRNIHGCIHIKEKAVKGVEILKDALKKI